MRSTNKRKHGIKESYNVFGLLVRLEKQLKPSVFITYWTFRKLVRQTESILENVDFTFAKYAVVISAPRVSFEAAKEPKMEEEERIDEGAKGGSESYGSQHDVSLKRKITFDLYSGTFVKKPRLENPLPHSPAQEEDAADRGMTLLDSCARIFAHILTELRSYRTRSF